MIILKLGGQFSGEKVGSFQAKKTILFPFETIVEVFGLKSVSKTTLIAEFVKSFESNHSGIEIMLFRFEFREESEVIQNGIAFTLKIKILKKKF